MNNTHHATPEYVIATKENRKSTDPIRSKTGDYNHVPCDGKFLTSVTPE